MSLTVLQYCEMYFESLPFCLNEHGIARFPPTHSPSILYSIIYIYIIYSPRILILHTLPDCCVLLFTFCLVCQDEARVHKVTKRIHTLEEVNINVKLLTEMLSHYNKESSTDSDKEIIKVHTQNP